MGIADINPLKSLAVYQQLDIEEHLESEEHENLRWLLENLPDPARYLSG